MGKRCANSFFKLIIVFVLITFSKIVRANEIAITFDDFPAQEDKRAAIRIIATDENKRNQDSGSKFWP